MDFLYSCVNFIGLLLYLVAILGIIRGLCTYDLFTKKDEWRNSFLVFTLVILAPTCGYFIRDFAQYQKKLTHFEDVIKRESAKSNLDRFSLLSISDAFSNLSKNEQNKVIDKIFNQFYDNSLSSRCKFLNEYRDFDLSFIHKVKFSTEDELKKLYIDIDKSKDDSNWALLRAKVNIADFLGNAPQCILDEEFNKWNNDDCAWNRVILLDSIVLSRVYLERFPNGNHEYSARKIILDDEYSKSDYRTRKITSNYCGSTTISVTNRSSYPIDLNYHGTFAKGDLKVPGNSRKDVSIPNGYYLVSIHSQKLHCKSITERITCDGRYIPYDLDLKPER